jgi:hypothetical protein
MNFAAMSSAISAGVARLRSIVVSSLAFLDEFPIWGSTRMQRGLGRVPVVLRADIGHRDIKPENVVLGRHVLGRSKRAARGKTGRLRRDARARARRPW